MSRAIRECQIYQKGFDEHGSLQRAIAAYFGLVSFVDHNVGRLIDALAASGLAEDDAGHLFERPRRQSRHARPMGQIDDVRGIGRGADDHRRPDLPQGQVCREPVSLVDCFPTILNWTGVAPNPADRDLPGLPLDEIAARRRSARSFASTTRRARRPARS